MDYNALQVANGIKMKNRMKKTLLLSAAVALMGCQPKTNNAADDSRHNLIVYYSQTGTTAKVAGEFAQFINADTASIEAEDPYDGDFQSTIARCQKERQDSILPTLKPLNVDLAQYDTIYLGYPIWFGTYAPPVASFVKDNTLAGKVVIPFCTFGSGGLGSSVQALRKALPQARVIDGYGVRTARVDKCGAEIERFLIEAGIVEGEVEPLPEYGDMAAVSEDDEAVFNAACGSYQMPLGKAVRVARRETSQSFDYKFETVGDNDMKATIYVTKGKADDAQPEFTRVDR